MNIIQQKIRTFRLTDRFLDLVLLFLSARISLIIERIYHGKNWSTLDPQSFNFYSLIIIFAVWLILIQIFESEQLYRQIQIWDIIRNTTLISFIGVTTTITLDFLLKADLFHRFTMLSFGIISFIYSTVSYFIREFSLNAAEGHTLFWQPSFDMLFYNFNRPNSWLSLILTLGIPGMIVLKNASNLKQIILSHSMALPLIFGIIFSLITYLFAFISTVADGRTVWAAYPFLIPLVGYILDNKRSLAIGDE